MKRIQYNSPVVLTFVLISFLTLVLGNFTDNTTTLALFSVYRSSPTNPLTYVRLFGHVLGHANFEHFFNNLVLLLLLGPALEEKYGAKTMIYMIAFTALITGIAHMVFSPNSALLGASGIVFMFMLLSSFVNIQKGRIPLTLVICVVVFLGRELYFSFAYDNNISQFTHILGGICGGIFGFYINRKKTA
ncbi:MAG: rhomboid family intramembrane serine protease [Defluviitaleaceae bacterium]|nr:rhomboid family intramembrane serine protease [Defluviitaleaceae bacterium]